MTRQSYFIKHPYVALVAGAVFVLTAACGGKEEAKQDRATRAKKPDQIQSASTERPLRSAIDDKAEKHMTSVSPSSGPAMAVSSQPEKADVQATPEKKSYRELIREGKQLSADGKHDEAMAALERAAEMKPKAAQPRIEIARALIAAGKSAAARAHAEAAVEIAPTSSYAWNTLGRVEMAEGDMEAAVASFERATDESSDNSYAWNNLGYALLQLERFEEAANALEMATSGAKPTAYMWNNLGMAYEHLDRIVEARAAYRQASEAGSPKGTASLTRLEGVTSLKEAQAENEEPSEPDELALDLSDAGE